MSTARLRIGVMGCANIAERMVIPAILQSENYELVLVSSREEEKAKRYAEKFGCGYVTGYENLLADPRVQVVYMPLPTGLHFEWAMKALDAGKHILLEKSLASNLEEARLLVEKARLKNLLIQENFMFAFHRQFDQIRQLLAENRAGEIRCIRSSFGFPPFPDSGNIRYSKALGGGALLDAGAYTLKVSQLLLGNEIQVLGSSLTYDEQKDVDLYGGIFLQHPTGIVVETAFGFDHFYQCSLEIWGNKAKISADRIFTAGPGVQPKIRIEEQGNTEVIEVEADNHFLNLLDDFARTVASANFEAKYGEILGQAGLIQATRDKAIKTSKS
jgi:NDP-hexose-3-ketoreductase